jgi:adenylosuccinate synthase
MGKPWAEVGTTTGRLRRVGWFDAVASRYAAQLNGIDRLALTKLDVLDELSEIKICIGYRLDGHIIDHPPTYTEQYDRVEPIYETLPGWLTPTSHVRRWQDLPANARAYVERVARLVGAEVSMVSIGPGHDQIIEVLPVL